MKNTSSTLVSFCSLVLIIVACKTKNNPISVETPPVPSVTGHFALEYQCLATVPIYTQSSMLTGYSHKLYRIGTEFPIHVWDLSSNEWSQIPLPDITFARWDGAAITIGDSVFIIAIYHSCSYDIIVLDPSRNSLRHTGINLPDGFHYPAFCISGDKIVFLSPQCDSVFEYNSTDGILRKVCPNPFQSSLHYFFPIASGKSATHLYVFGGYTTFPKNKFCRLNLDNYTWEDLGVPSTLSQKILFGASFGNSFVLFSDSVSTYQYSFLTDQWSIDTAEVPVFPHDLSGNLLQGEWSFFAEDSCLYGIEHLSQKLWKVTR